MWRKDGHEEQMRRMRRWHDDDADGDNDNYLSFLKCLFSDTT
jgi:hypothetical protein